VAKDAPSFVKVFAAPGIDSTTHEQGVFNSGAGFDPNAPTLKTPPYDWNKENPALGYGTGRLVGNYPETTAPDATSLKVRKRGLSPFGGPFSGTGSILSHQHPGGIADMNPGAGSLIAGGRGQASSFCRVNGKYADVNRRLKLPVLPVPAPRGGVTSFPSGGGSHEPLTAPLQPQISGWPTIFKFVSGAK
jgi:hypothetical protein